MKTSKSGIDLIKKYEGCVLKAYKCPSGVWTIGYGHTKGVKKGQICTKKQAEYFLSQDLKTFEKGVLKGVKVTLNQNQFDALVSFTYNVGLGAFKSSTLLRYINKKDFSSASKELLKWNKSNGKVLSGLVKRRAAERQLFLKPCSVYYTVKKGDTLSGVAKKYKTTYQSIAKLNGIEKPYIIYINQKLKIK